MLLEPDESYSRGNSMGFFKKFLLLVFLVIALTVFLLYQGYRIIPLVDFEKRSSFKGNPEISITIEMTNPWTESKQLQQIWIEKQLKQIE